MSSILGTISVAPGVSTPWLLFCGVRRMFSARLRRVHWYMTWLNGLWDYPYPTGPPVLQQPPGVSLPLDTIDKLGCHLTKGVDVWSMTWHLSLTYESQSFIYYTIFIGCRGTATSIPTYGSQGSKNTFIYWGGAGICNSFIVLP